MFCKNLFAGLLLVAIMTTSVNAQLFFNRRVAPQTQQYAPMNVQQQTACYQQQLQRQRQQQLAQQQAEMYRIQLAAQQYRVGQQGQAALSPASPAQKTATQQPTAPQARQSALMPRNRVVMQQQYVAYTDRRTGRRFYRVVQVPTYAPQVSPAMQAQQATAKLPVNSSQRDVARASWELDEPIAPALNAPEGTIKLELNEPVGSETSNVLVADPVPTIEPASTIQPASAIEPITPAAATPVLDQNGQRSVLEKIEENTELAPGSLSGLDLSGPSK